MQKCHEQYSPNSEWAQCDCPIDAQCMICKCTMRVGSKCCIDCDCRGMVEYDHHLLLPFKLNPISLIVYDGALPKDTMMLKQITRIPKKITSTMQYKALILKL